MLNRKLSQLWLLDTFKRVYLTSGKLGQVGSSFPMVSLFWEGCDVFVTPELPCPACGTPTPALPVQVGAVGWRILGLPLLWAPFSAVGTALVLDNHKSLLRTYYFTLHWKNVNFEQDGFKKFLGMHFFFFPHTSVVEKYFMLLSC